MVAGEAWEEAIALLDLLGIQHTDITSPKTATGGSHNPPCDTLDPNETSDEEDNTMETEAAVLQYLVDIQRSSEWDAVDKETQDVMHTLTCAATALDIEDQEGL